MEIKPTYRNIDHKMNSTWLYNWFIHFDIVLVMLILLIY